jgi:hypothetical protein
VRAIEEYQKQTERIASMDMLIAVGFGFAAVTRDGEIVYHEPVDAEGWDDFWTVADAEEVAKGDPDHDWRIIKEAPLRSMEYQRQGEGKWVLVDSGRGFA